jgi:hypothetical protein
MAQFTIGAQVTAADATTRYKNNATANASNWVARTLAPRRNPIDAAKAASGEWLTKLNQVGTAGFEAGLSRVNMTDMANTIAASGGTYSTGVTNKSPKYQRAMSGLLPVIYQTRDNLPPRGTIEDNIGRSAQFQRAMAAVRGQYRG